MANELSVSVSVASSLGAKLAKAMQATGSPANSQSRLTTQDATTSAAAVVISPVVAASAILLALQNLDQTNYVQVGVDASVATPIARLRPGVNGAGGIPAVIPYEPGVTYYVKANTATCTLVVEAV